MNENKTDLPKDVLGLYCHSGKIDLEEITKGVFVCKHCFVKIGVLK